MTDDALLRELGARCAQRRLDRNVTQAALAREAGVSLATVKRLEAGLSVQLANWLRVLRALDLVDGLLDLIPDPARSPIHQLREQQKPRRQRASPAPIEAAEEPWSWGDES